MKIAMVSPFFADHGGGIERVAGHLAFELRALGHEVTWAACSNDSLEHASPQTLPLPHINPVERTLGLPLPMLTRRAVRQLGATVSDSDAVIVHDSLYMPSLAGARAAKRQGKPLLVIQHIANVPYTNVVLRWAMRSANRLLTNRMLRQADHVVFISAFVQAAFASVTTKRPTHLLFNGVDSAVFHPPPKLGRVALREVAGIEAVDRVALFVGRFVEKKGLNILHELAQRRPDVTFLFAGAGPLDPQHWDLQNVRSLGRLSPTELSDIYPCADLLILPSVGEGYPLVIQEAMACGVPVICGADTATADPCAQEWVFGVDIDMSAPLATAERCSAALDAHDLDVEARKAMAAYAASAYSWSAMAASISDILAGSRSG